MKTPATANAPHRPFQPSAFRLSGFSLAATLAAGAAAPSDIPHSAFRTPHSDAPAARPNILLITADDLGLQLSCYGDPHIKTPNLDALAASGARFVTAYIAQASCSPSRSAILTGLFPHGNGQIGLAPPGFSMHKENTPPTLPTLLKRAGYRTAIIGKLHVEPVSAFSFDDNLMPHSQTRDVREVASRAAAFFKRTGDRPFFLYLNYADPHKTSGPSAGFPAQVKGLPAKPFKPGDIPAWPFQRVESPALLAHIANFYNCALRIDAGIGMLVDALKSSGKYDNTIIIYLGDNGPPFARGKTSCYEAGLRQAFLVRWPGVAKEGLASDAMASSVDIMPTLLDAAGVPAPKMHGRSLRAPLQGDNKNWRAYLAGEFHFHGASPFFPRRAIRDTRYKLIHNPLAGRSKPSPSIDGDTAPTVAATPRYNGTPAQKAMQRLADPPEWELYDLSVDPWEFENLAESPAHRETLARMKKALADWQAETDDPYRDPKLLESTLAQSQGKDAFPNKKRSAQKKSATQKKASAKK